MSAGDFGPPSDAVERQDAPTLDPMDSESFGRPQPAHSMVQLSLSDRVDALETEVEKLKQAKLQQAERTSYAIRSIMAGLALLLGCAVTFMAFWHLSDDIKSGQGVTITLVTRAVITASAGAILYLILRAAEQFTTPFENRLQIENARKGKEMTFDEKLKLTTRVIDQMSKSVSPLVAAFRKKQP